MKALLVGSGGREHALAWKLAQSPLVHRVFCAPGNAGTALEPGVENIGIGVHELEKLRDFAQDADVELTVVGPEQPLIEGITDLFAASGLRIFGPSAAAARLEGSKAFTKEILERSQVRTARCATFERLDLALEYVRQQALPIVIKADGLAAGKGVVIAATLAEAENTLGDFLEKNTLGPAGKRVVIEEFLAGKELSVMALCSGENCHLLLPSRDHKTLNEGGKGPNTGGMGSFTPVDDISADFLQTVKQTIFVPVLRTLNQMGMPFYGVLFAGLMVCEGQPYVLEFNVRLGDPETQSLMWQMKSDLVPHLLAIAEEGFIHQPLEWHSGVSLCTVLAAAGYPGQVRKGDPIFGLENANDSNVKVFHAGTTVDTHGTVVTSGGRVLGLVSRAQTLEQARVQVYSHIGPIQFPGMQYRKDIGA